MLTVQQPTDGIIQLGIRITTKHMQCAVAVSDLGGIEVDTPTDGELPILGALALTDLTGSVTVAIPSGKIPILGAVVIGYISNGVFAQGIQS